ncbi:MAG: hypothetical protein EXR71_02495 [Myxococcales bacterium]|nr:hypothetical protein [Myxococcales bacterium]
MHLPPPPDPFVALLLDGRLPALLVGIVLLGWGERIYGVLVVAPGVLAGVYLAAWAQPLFHFDAITLLVVTVALAAAGALLCHFVAAMAVRAAGAGLFAALAWFALPLAQSGPVPWWVPLVGAALGALVFPALYKIALRPLTALVGAWSIAWAVKHPGNPYVVLALAAAGTAVQVALAGTGRGGGDAPAKKISKGKKT